MHQKLNKTSTLKNLFLAFPLPPSFLALPTCCRRQPCFSATYSCYLYPSPKWHPKPPNGQSYVFGSVLIHLGLCTSLDTAESPGTSVKFPPPHYTALTSISLFCLLKSLTFSLPLFWEFIHSPNTNYHTFDSHIFICTPNLPSKL